MSFHTYKLIQLLILLNSKHCKFNQLAFPLSVIS